MGFSGLDIKAAGVGKNPLPPPFFAGRPASESGSVLFYIFLAVGLLAALTFAFVGNDRESVTTQSAGRLTEDLYSQIHLIKSAVLECAMEFPNGGGDMDGDGTIDSADNPNNPYPVNPSFADNPYGPAANDNVRNLTCTGASSAAEAAMFSGANTKGRSLPQPPGGFGEWLYINDAAGVRIRITGPNEAATVQALTRLDQRFASCQIDANYGGCGATCLTAWILRAACP